MIVNRPYNQTISCGLSCRRLETSAVETQAFRRSTDYCPQRFGDFELERKGAGRGEGCEGRRGGRGGRGGGRRGGERDKKKRIDIS